MKRSINRGGCVLLSVATIVMSCGQVLGQASSGGAGDQPANDDAVLRGPEVKDNSVPGNKGKFTGGGGNARAARGGWAVTPRAMMQAVEVLKKDTTPAPDRLTDDQAKKIKVVEEEFRASQKAFFEENRAELVELRNKLSPEARRKIDERLRSFPGFNARAEQGQKGKKGKDAAKDQAKDQMEDSDGMTSESMDSKNAPAADQAAVLARLKELAAKSPDPKDTQTRAWGVLSASQKKLVEAELQRVAKSREGMRDGMSDEREMDRVPELKQGADGKIDISSLPPAMRARFQKMTPEQREKAIERLSERAKNRK